MNKNIMVNAYISQNNIKIIATARHNDHIINIHEESISEYNDNNNSKNKNNIKCSIKRIVETIESKISKKIKSIGIIFDDFMKSSELFEFSTKIIEEKIECNDKKFLNIDDYELIINKNKHGASLKNNEEVLISIIPFKFFYVENDQIIEKESNQFPFNKKVKKLRILFTTRYMDKKCYQRIIDLFDLISNVKIKEIALESQIAVYDNNLINTNNDFVDKLSYGIAIKKNKTMLITSINNIVIKTNKLDYSFSNLIDKIANDFNISNYEAKKLLDCYGDLDNNNSNRNIYFSHSIKKDISKSITKSNISDVIKSFLKSICIQANKIMTESKINNNWINNRIELKFIGYLSKDNNIKQYCSKYFDNNKIKINMVNNNESIYEWNNSYVYSKNFRFYIDTLNNLKTDNIYYNTNYNYYPKNSLFVEGSPVKNISASTI